MRTVMSMNNFVMLASLSTAIPPFSDGLQHIWIMPIVFFISLFAVSFPSLSKRSSFSSIPRIVFFVGKHFGTGVILSTAFVHLLQDAFNSLNDQNVRRISRVGDWTGLIVLGSLLMIFCIEYVSTSYVASLNQDSHCDAHGHSHNSDIESTPNGSTASHSHHTNERTTLILPHSHSFTYVHPVDPSQSEIFESHHRSQSHFAHASHHQFSRRLLQLLFNHEEPHPPIGVDSSPDRTESSATIDVGTEEPTPNDPQELEREEQEEEQKDSAKSGNIQVVGILVLQLGIMIHSSVIGLTLSISSGSEFTSLVTAIVFHQLFEGLSLGTRIATLPNSSKLLQSTLAFAFAIAVPVGIIIGLCTLRGTHEDVKMKLIQGLMAAISSGMLIYAACVEMLAGDFIMDPTLWKSSVWKQVLAVGSLVMGAGAMAIVGLWS